MRISGGTAKGRTVGFGKAFSRITEGDKLRPTSSKVREAIFDIIRNELPGAVFLDLYAGTGGVGIEALSRGAGKVVFVESNGMRVKMIKHLLSEFNFKERSRVINSRAYEFAKKESEKDVKYDIIFLDPPYYTEELTRVLPIIGEGDILKESGVVIVEHSSRKEPPEAVKRLKAVKKYRYGDTMLTLYRMEKL